MDSKVFVDVFKECFNGEPDGTGAFLSPSSPGILTLTGNLTAGEASKPAAGAPIATHAKHLSWSLDLFLDGVRQGKHPDELDWDGDWDDSPVTEDEWLALQAYMLKQIACLGALFAAGGKGAYSAIGALAHTAYHLGAIQVKYDVIKRD